jgi:hypothetical protein
MNCIWVEKISALIDGELSADETRALERHIADCEECQLARADFLSFRSQIVAFKPEIDRATSARALAEILSTRKPVATPRPSSGGLFPALRFGPALAMAAAVIIAALIGVSLYLYSRQQKANSTTLAANTNRNSSKPTPAAPQDPAPRSTSGGVEQPATGDTPKQPVEKSQKPKVRPALPKLPTVPDDRVSPWSNQSIAQNNSETSDTARSVDAQTLTAHHLEQSELLLRSFRNVRTDNQDQADISYERKRAEQLVYRNIVLRREADTSGDVQVASLLDSLEPILLDIANLPDKPKNQDVMAIKERLRRKNLVALLQVNSTALARAND